MRLRAIQATLAEVAPFLNEHAVSSSSGPNGQQFYAFSKMHAYRAVLRQLEDVPSIGHTVQRILGDPTIRISDDQFQALHSGTSNACVSYMQTLKTQVQMMLELVNSVVPEPDTATTVAIQIPEGTDVATFAGLVTHLQDFFSGFEDLPIGESGERGGPVRLQGLDVGSNYILLAAQTAAVFTVIGLVINAAYNIAKKSLDLYQQFTTAKIQSLDAESHARYLAELRRLALEEQARLVQSAAPKASLESLMKLIDRGETSFVQKLSFQSNAKAPESVRQLFFQPKEFAQQLAKAFEDSATRKLFLDALTEGQAPRQITAGDAGSPTE